MTHDEAIHFLGKIVCDYPEDGYYQLSIEHAITILERVAALEKECQAFLDGKDAQRFGYSEPWLCAETVLEILKGETESRDEKIQREIEEDAQQTEW